MANAPKTTAPKTAIAAEAIAAIVSLSQDKAAWTAAVAAQPELATALTVIQDQIAEAGSPRNVAVVNNLTGPTDCLTDWMSIEKGKSSYLGCNAKIADRSFACRFVLPTEKAKKFEAEIKLLTVKVALYAASEAKAMGLSL